MTKELYDVQRGKKDLMPYANSECPDEHAPPYSLIWTFYVLDVLRSSTYTTISNHSVSQQQGPDQTARMRRLIRDFVIGKLPKGIFRVLHINYYGNVYPSM